jgi:hypothetical protein
MSIALNASLRRASVTFLGVCLAFAMLAGPAAMAKGGKDEPKPDKEEKAKKDKDKEPTVVIADEAALLVVINKADAKTLISLPGIGKKTAVRVIEGRPYKTLDELTKVKGIAKKRLAKVKSSVGKNKVPESLFADDDEE